MGGESKIWGNDGDDYIRQREQTVSATVHAGKGDDTVNKIYYDETDEAFKERKQYAYNSNGDLL
jgi:hypothetical protein